MPGLDVDLARSLTPGCTEVLHLNHAGASLLPQPVLDAVVGHLELEAHTGGYEAAAVAAPAVDRTYDAVAELLGCERHEVALTDSASRSWASVAYGMPLGPGDQVLTGRAEYGANAIALLHLRERTGCEIVLIGDDEHGQLDLAALATALEDERARLVSLVHVPTQGGLVNPVVEAGALCRAAGVPLLLDACQSAGQLPLDVEELGCDALSGTGRKFLRGPRGTGFLYVRQSFLERLEPAMLDLHSATWVTPDRFEVRPDSRRFEMWEFDVAARIGLGVAVDHALGWGLDAIADRNQGLAAGLRTRLAGLPGVTVRDQGVERCAIVTFTAHGRSAGDLATRLRSQRINVSVASATSAQHDLPHRGLDELVRASVHYTTTDDELDRFTAALEGLLA